MRNILSPQRKALFPCTGIDCISCVVADAAVAAFGGTGLFPAYPGRPPLVQPLGLMARAGRVMVWYTEQVALPLALRDLRERLLLGYYRQPGALAHDGVTIAANAVTFNGPDSDVAARAHGATIRTSLPVSLHGCGGRKRSTQIRGPRGPERGEADYCTMSKRRWLIP